MRISGALLIEVHFWSLAACRKHDTNQRSASGTILRFDRAAVRHNDSTTDRKAQANASHAAIRLAPIELLPHPLLVTRREPRSTIGNFEKDLVPSGAGRQLDF